MSEIVQDYDIKIDSDTGSQVQEDVRLKKRVEHHNFASDAISQDEEYIKLIKRLKHHTSPYLSIVVLGKTPFRYGNNGWLIYDSVTGGFLLATALLTPYRAIPGLDDHCTIDAVFFISRIVDLFFIFDTAMNFFRPTIPETNGRLLSKIRRDYLSGRFIFDLVSSFPYDSLAWCSHADNKHKSRIPNFMIMLPYLRMLKMARLLRTVKLLKDLQVQLHINGSYLECLKLLAILIIVSHWMACFWVIIARTSRHTPDWTLGQYDSSFDVYIAALYFSVMTLTSVGYGDIHPENTQENLCAIFMMLISSVLWAYIIGSLTAILLQMNPDEIYFRNKLEDFNKVLRKNKVDGHLTSRVRRYWIEVQGIKKQKILTRLLSELSPKLQSDVLHFVGGFMFKTLSMFSSDSEQFLSELSRSVSLCSQLFAPMETIVIRPTLDGSSIELLGRSLCTCVHRGVVAFNGRIYNASGRNSFWHEDFILDNPNLRIQVPASALTYTEVQFIPYVALDRLLQLSQFSKERCKWRQYKVVFSVKRGITRFAEELLRLRERNPSATLYDVDIIQSKVRTDSIMGITELAGSVTADEDKLDSILSRLGEFEDQIKNIELLVQRKQHRE